MAFPKDSFSQLIKSTEPFYKSSKERLHSYKERSARKMRHSLPNTDSRRLGDPGSARRELLWEDFRKDSDEERWNEIAPISDSASDLESGPTSKDFSTNRFQSRDNGRNVYSTIKLSVADKAVPEDRRESFTLKNVFAKNSNDCSIASLYSNACEDSIFNSATEDYFQEGQCADNAVGLSSGYLTQNFKPRSDNSQSSLIRPPQLDDEFVSYTDGSDCRVPLLYEQQDCDDCQEEFKKPEKYCCKKNIISEGEGSNSKEVPFVQSDPICGRETTKIAESATVDKNTELSCSLWSNCRLKESLSNQYSSDENRVKTDKQSADRAFAPPPASTSMRKRWTKISACNKRRGTSDEKCTDRDGSECFAQSRTVDGLKPVNLCKTDANWCTFENPETFESKFNFRKSEPTVADTMISGKPFSLEDCGKGLFDIGNRPKRNASKIQFSPPSSLERRIFACKDSAQLNSLEMRENIETKTFSDILQQKGVNSDYDSVVYAGSNKVHEQDCETENCTRTSKNKYPKSETCCSRSSNKSCLLQCSCAMVNNICRDFHAGLKISPILQISGCCHCRRTYVLCSERLECISLNESHSECSRKICRSSKCEKFDIDEKGCNCVKFAQKCKSSNDLLDGQSYSVERQNKMESSESDSCEGASRNVPKYPKLLFYNALSEAEGTFGRTKFNNVHKAVQVELDDVVTQTRVCKKDFSSRYSELYIGVDKATQCVPRSVELYTQKSLKKVKDAETRCVRKVLHKQTQNSAYNVDTSSKEHCKTKKCGIAKSPNCPPSPRMEITVSHRNFFEDHKSSPEAINVQECGNDFAFTQRTEIEVMENRDSSEWDKIYRSSRHNRRNTGNVSSNVPTWDNYTNVLQELNNRPSREDFAGVDTVDVKAMNVGKSSTNRGSSNQINRRRMSNPVKLDLDY